MKPITIGILAHVDAGKTTLSEALLYTCGSIRKAGRVDHQDTFLDTNEMERARGITIFSKQARLTYKDIHLTLLDTPGHVDFSAEMERTLQVLDAAILVVSGMDGVQSHTRTLWRLLEQYKIPTLLFINKMDQPGTNREGLLVNVKKKLSENCVDWNSQNPEFAEEIAVCDDSLMEAFLEERPEFQEQMNQAIPSLFRQRKLFPCFFGSALQNEGIDALLEGLFQVMRPYACAPIAETPFAARVYKIGRDERDERLTYAKIMSGTLRVKEVLGQDKVNQIRLYDGTKFQTVQEVSEGEICAVTGLTETWPGQGLGALTGNIQPVIVPVLSYQVLLPEDMDALRMLPKLRLLEEEEPTLHLVWNEEACELMVQVLGEVQLEILKTMIKKRFQVDVSFGNATIVYQETIANTVEGVGHFEPLRHYAEVHLLLSPKERGSGLEFASEVSVDELDLNWQRLIMTHLQEKVHRGVLTGGAITDMKITLAAGRAHLKHTEGGDFRQATYRAVRQGLMQAESVLLEPFYRYRLEIPSPMVGRALADLEQIQATMQVEQVDDKRVTNAADSSVVKAGDTDDTMAVITGIAPVRTMANYSQKVAAYTKGLGALSVENEGYYPCKDAEKILAEIGYDPELDMRNTPDSVFCAHGAGFVVPWYEVPDYMQVESVLKKKVSEEEELERAAVRKEQMAKAKSEDSFLGLDEIDAILSKTYHANDRPEVHSRYGWSKSAAKPQHFSEAMHTSSSRITNAKRAKDKYLLVDGYNIIYAWNSLRELADVNIDSARGKLIDLLSHYQAITGIELIVVFDCYRVKGHATEMVDFHNIHVVYTAERETADFYIERFAHENAGKYQITVATSDGLEQIIIWGQGCQLYSAREFEQEVARAVRELRENYLDKPAQGERTSLLDGVDHEAWKKTLPE